jgi:glucose-1-phosphate adenylyltransferase
MDLLADNPELHLDDPAWPIFTLDHQRMPARISADARIENALISPGCVIRGTVKNAVLGPGVVVEEGATVSDSVVLHDVVIRENADVRFAIVDRNVEIGNGSTIGAAPAGEATTEDLVLVGLGAKVDGHCRLQPGERVEPAGRGIELT